MPSKALIEAANAFHRAKVLDSFGMAGAEKLSIDVPSVLKRVRQLRDDFVGGTLKLTDDLGERSIAGYARFVDPHTLVVNGRQLKAKKIIIATGSHPVIPKPWGELGKRILTSDDLFEQETLPLHMGVFFKTSIFFHPPFFITSINL